MMTAMSMNDAAVAAERTYRKTYLETGQGVTKKFKNQVNWFTKT